MLQQNATETFRNKEFKQGPEKYHMLVNPFSGEVLKQFAYQSKDEIQETVRLCDKAFQLWKQVSLSERISAIENFSQLLKSNKEELALLATEEMGKPITASEQEIDHCINIVDYCVENAEKHLKDKKEKYPKGRALVQYKAQGVILSIQPWNFPYYQVIRNSVPNLLAGNTMVVKHAENVWGCAEKVEELFKEASLPEHVYKNIYAQSEDISILMEMSEVRGVTFTGSAATGRKVAEKAGKELKKCVLELGGSDAYIICEDADLELAAKMCVKGRFTNTGQVCTAAKRFIVLEDVYDAFREKVISQIDHLKVGDPSDDAVTVGPMARKDLKEKLLDQVQESLKQGAQCAYEKKIDVRLKGSFINPMILENLKPGMPAYDEELFGPVMSFIKVKSVEEAIKVANSSQFGLGGGVFSVDSDRALEIANQLDSGMTAINDITGSKGNLPFGGVKNSGFGREHAQYGFHEFVNIKSLFIAD